MAMRCDMVGFTPCEKDIERLRLFEQRDHFESRFRDAIRRGTKLHDKDLAAP